MYLSKVTIDSYKGIEHLEVNFSPLINVIIGENGRCKSALIDAIRLLYNIGEPIREISVGGDDFYEKIIPKNGGGYTIQRSELIKIVYEFRKLTSEQKGAFFEYMVVDTANEENDYAKVEIQYKDDKKYPIFSYSTGSIEGQKADMNTFRLFQHYYLSALRDSTRDLSNVRGNILGKVIKRLIERKKSEEDVKGIIKEANDKLLARDEVIETKTNINDNLNNIFKKIDTNQISLHIEQSKIDYIVNVIKPYLPHDASGTTNEGFQLWQNSLGFNNLIYIATVLGDIKERIVDDKIPHYALLIEEPESHIHPQLQLSLYNFLKEANQSDNSQLFITSHSPTLTSKVPFDNLIVLDNAAYRISEVFEERESEAIIQDTITKTPLDKVGINTKRKQLERYIDVTKSQMFFAKSCLFIEGISEELLITAFCKVEKFNLEDYRIELVNVDGTSFYPFLFLFNSSNIVRKLPKNIAILTDDDRFSDSKKPKYNFDQLAVTGYVALDEFLGEIKKGTPSTRVNNLSSVKNSQPNILVKTSYQTLEYDLCLNNVENTKQGCRDNFLFKYLAGIQKELIKEVNTYIDSLKTEPFSDDEQKKIALLLWKIMPTKAEFAQDFAIYITENLTDAQSTFKVPLYIKDALSHLKTAYGV